jgi:hypothetical protein
LEGYLYRCGPSWAARIERSRPSCGGVGANEKTVKNWFAGASGPSGEHLVALVRHSESVLEIFLRLAGREPTLAENKLTNACEKPKEALALIDMLKSKSD